MPLIIQKYSKAYLASVEKIKIVAQHICQSTKVGNSVVVVAPAIAEITDRWIGYADEISTNPYLRERNMILAAGEQAAIALLSMALQELEQPAISLNSAQIGIPTEVEQAVNEILDIQIEKIERYLNEKKVVIITDFQYVISTDNIKFTTSDWQFINVSKNNFIVNLAAKLKAGYCEFYSDKLGCISTKYQIKIQEQ